MASDYKAMATSIIQGLGGTGNLTNVTHCATRLRVVVKDPAKIDQAAVKKVNGVLGLEVAGNQVQVIVGQVIEDLYLAVEKQVGSLAGKAGEGVASPDKPKKPLDYVAGFMSMLASIMSPVIPGLVAAGFLATILTIMSVFFGIDSSNSTYAILYNFSQAVFYFMPVFVAYTSAQRFNTEPVLAMLLACALLYPDWVTMVNTMTAEGQEFVSYFGLPVTLTTYNGAVVQIILSVWVMSKIDMFLKRAIPEVVRHFLKPFLLLLVMSVITLTVTGPLGALITDYFTAFINWISEVAPWFTVAAMVIFFTTVGVVLPGFHMALVPIATANIATIGYDNLLNIAFFCCTITPGFIALAVALKTKSNNLRQIAFPAALSALFGGISEPTTYGISYKMVRPYYVHTIVAIATALLAGIMQLKCYAFGGYSLTNILLYMGPDRDMANFTNALILVAFMAVASFVLTWVIGFDDSIYDEEDEDGNPLPESEGEPAKKAPTANESFVLPAQGEYIAQADIADNVFAQGILGPCFGVKPTDGDVVSPVAGSVYAVAGTKHAVTIVTDGGAEVLVHIGIDSVKLDGAGLETFVQKGDRVTAGQRIASFDKDVFEKAGVDTTIVCSLINGKDYASVAFQQGDAVMVATV